MYSLKEKVQCNTVSACKQEITLDIALEPLLSLLFISQVKECVTKTLQILQISRDQQTFFSTVSEETVRVEAGHGPG